MRIAISGATGLLGWHLRCALHAAGIDTLAIERTAWSDPATLCSALSGADVVVHAAGANRGDDAEILATNVALAQTLAKAIDDMADAPHVVYTNSTHIDRETAYGRSKREAAAILDDATDRFADVVVEIGLDREVGRPVGSTNPGQREVISIPLEVDV